jgi:hypothetical protein
MLPLNLADITATDIRNLIDSEVAESVTLEYKEEFPSMEDKKEFLYDISALANQAGGDLIYGMADRRGEDKQATGIADHLGGMRIANVQTEIARFSNLIRDGIAPRLSGVVMRHVICPDGDVLVIRVPHSWNRPHMVTLGGVNRFVGRAPTGKYPMSVDEIRRAFSEQRELSETIDNWRSNRADLASRNEGPVIFASNVIMLFHVIPASAFSREPLRETWVVPDRDKLAVYVPHRSTNRRYNADGYLATAQIHPKSGAYGYAQMFRSGIMEYADSQIYFPVSQGGAEMILGQEIEKQIVNCYEDAVNRMRRLGRTGIAYAGLSLIGVMGKNIYSRGGHWGSVDQPIRGNIFNSPEVLVDINDAEDSPYANTLLPLVDTMWQAGGREGTPQKTADEWTPFANW